MKKEFPHRKQIRLKEYDYSQEGYYFITICTQNRLQILSKIINEIGIDAKCVGANCVRPIIKLSKIGQVIDNEINKISKIYNNIFIDEYVVMPNHIHLIIEIESGRTQFAPTISQVIKQYKGSITKQLNYNIWQKSFYEHVIRNEKEYYLIKQYIQNNPLNWEKDKYY